jgi:hypothetical protein
MAERDQLGAKLRMVIDLSVVGNPDRAVFIRHGLMACRREVDNRQTSVTKRDALTGANEDARVIRSAMLQCAGHARDRRLVERKRIVEGEKAGNAAHRNELLGSSPLSDSSRIGDEAVYAAGLRGGKVDREVEQSVAGRLDGHGVERVASGLHPRLGSAEIPPRTANELQRKVGLVVIPASTYRR